MPGRRRVSKHQTMSFRSCVQLPRAGARSKGGAHELGALRGVCRRHDHRRRGSARARHCRLRRAGRPDVGPVLEPAARTGAAFRRGLLVALSNPKTLIFFSASLPILSIRSCRLRRNSPALPSPMRRSGLPWISAGCCSPTSAADGRSRCRRCPRPARVATASRHFEHSAFSRQLISSKLTCTHPVPGRSVRAFTVHLNCRYCRLGAGSRVWRSKSRPQSRPRPA